MPVAVHSKDYAFSADYGIAISEPVVVQLGSLDPIVERWVGNILPMLIILLIFCLGKPILGQDSS